MKQLLRWLPAHFTVRSVALRVGLSVALACIVMLIVSVALLYALMLRLHEREDLYDLNERIEILRTTLRSHGQDPQFLLQEVQSEAEAGRRHPAQWPERFSFYARILDEAGLVIAETRGMGSVAPVPLFPAPISEKADILTQGKVSRWWFEGRAFDATAALVREGASGPVRIIQVALDRTDERAWMRRHRDATALVLACGGLFAAYLGFWSARRALRPIKQLTLKVEQVTDRGQVTARVHDETLPVELRQLARSFDEMLSRIEATHLRLSAFAAYAAHEFRTPLQILSGEAEAALAEERTPRGYCRVLESSLEEYQRLSALVNDLLLIGQAWDPRTKIECDPIDVRTELESIREYFEPLASEERHVILCDGQGCIEGDVTLLRRAICNLVANALRHTPPLGRVSLWVGFATSSELSIRVTDTGCGIAPEQLARIQAGLTWTEKNGSADGAPFTHGLGLQIVRSIAELHGARLRIFSELGRGTTAELLFPKAANGLAPASNPTTVNLLSAANMAGT